MEIVDIIVDGVLILFGIIASLIALRLIVAVFMVKTFMGLFK